MPTWGHSHFVVRALESLLAQELADWELVVVDDGSPDDTHAVLEPYLADPRIHLERLEQNEGLGAALNRALDLARGELIAYLPSDDVVYEEHLETLAARLEVEPEAVLAYSGVRHHGDRVSEGAIEGEALQLVQVMHRRTADRWVERDELTTDDLERMLWSRLRARGAFVATGQVSCEWVDHPAQRHKVVREGAYSGLNPYRSRYGVRRPLRFHSSVGNRTDEVELYRSFRERPETPRAPDGLTILLVGELAWNPERVLALEERGHRLLGLWTPEPWGFNTVGPLPFGHVEDVPRAGWEDAVRRLRPDVIYAQLNWQAVPFAHEVLTRSPDIPFVWHLKESPFHCLGEGTWPRLVDLCTRSDGQIYTSEELRGWMTAMIPSPNGHLPPLVLDGDLPKREWFDGEPSARLSKADGDPHTFVPGRAMGLDLELVDELARAGIHLHLYGEFTGEGVTWLQAAERLAPRHVHRHGLVTQADWVREFSRYDAGWLHVFRSRNGGDLRRATWDDLNVPARLPTLMAAGVPPLQRDNAGSTVAMQRLVREPGVGVFLRDARELRDELLDKAHMEPLRHRLQEVRGQFTFDHHADRLIDYLRLVIEARA